LLDDVKGETTRKARNFREEGTHVLSTFRWESESKKVTFLFTKDIIEGISTMESGRSMLGGLHIREKVIDGMNVDNIKEGGSWV
jgi:hypothetical protein